MSLDPPPSRTELARMYKARTGRNLPNDPGAAIACASAVGITAPALSPIAWPLAFTVPWSRLVSDNAKYGAVILFDKPKLILTAAYREAKNAIRRALRTQFGDVVPAAVPLRLEAKVYVPDRRPHDTANFAKLVHDALQNVLVASDRWLYDTRWIRAGVDVDHPRADITITPIPQES